MAFLPMVSLSGGADNVELHFSHNQPGSSLISSSSSAASSSAQSPAVLSAANHHFLINASSNNLSTDDPAPSSSSSSYQPQLSWPSGASKMARVANKIVNSINSVSTPKQSHKQTMHHQQQQQNVVVQSQGLQQNASNANLQQTQVLGTFFEYFIFTQNSNVYIDKISK